MSDNNHLDNADLAETNKELAYYDLRALLDERPLTENDFANAGLNGHEFFNIMEEKGENPSIYVTTDQNRLIYSLSKIEGQNQADPQNPLNNTAPTEERIALMQARAEELAKLYYELEKMTINLLNR